MTTTTMQRSRARTATVIGLIAALALAGTAERAGATTTTAAATPTRVLAVRRAECNTAITWRQVVLEVTRQRITAARRITDEQKAALLAPLSAAADNLSTVNRPAVAAATTLAQLNAACQAIFTDNRVFAVVVPQGDLLARADILGSFQASFANRSQALKDQGKDTTAVDAALSSAGNRLTSAVASINSVTVASFNADPAGAAAAFRSARTDLYGALLNLVTARDALVTLGG